MTLNDLCEVVYDVLATQRVWNRLTDDERAAFVVFVSEELGIPSASFVEMLQLLVRHTAVSGAGLDRLWDELINLTKSQDGKVRYAVAWQLIHSLARFVPVKTAAMPPREASGELEYDCDILPAAHAAPKLNERGRQGWSLHSALVLGTSGHTACVQYIYIRTPAQKEAHA